MTHKNVLITGAARGIGRAIALAFADAGWNLGLITLKNTKSLEEIAEAVRDMGQQCMIMTGDIGDPDVCARFYKEARMALGPISCLINNAGIAHIGLLSDMSIDEWQHLMNVNLNSLFYMSRQVIPEMVSVQSGSIINISSVWGICGASCETAYSASKGAVNSFTKALGKELAPSHIQVNAIACGVIDTDMNHLLSEEERTELVEEIPACRMGTPKEVASLALELAGSHPYLNGQVIVLDGGWI